MKPSVGFRWCIFILKFVTYLDHTPRIVSSSEESPEAENSKTNENQDEYNSNHHPCYPGEGAGHLTLVNGLPTLAVAITFVATRYTLTTITTVLGRKAGSYNRDITGDWGTLFLWICIIIMNTKLITVFLINAFDRLHWIITVLKYYLIFIKKKF